MLAKRKALPTTDSLGALEQVALSGAPEGTRLEVVMEPTGPAWLPIAVFFSARGHLVFRVSSHKAADLRRFLSRHAKSNGIDADALGPPGLVAPDSLRPLILPDAERAALDRRVRACAAAKGRPDQLRPPSRREDPRAGPHPQGGRPAVPISVPWLKGGSGRQGSPSGEQLPL